MRTVVQTRKDHKTGASTLALLFAFWIVAGVPITALAGNGTFQGGAHNFCVSVRFNATAAQLAQIRTAFQNGSQVLADATDGQHRFGKVTIVNNSGASTSSEYWVNAAEGRAYATQGRYGVRGEHVMLYFDSNFQATDGADGDAYTVAHEHAHHSYGVLDEYSGPAGAAECAPPPDVANLSFSLMDNYFTRGGRAFGAGYTLNEFCVVANHDPDADTFQSSVHGQSAWETIATHPKRSAAAPPGLPADAPPAAHAVTFADGIGGLRAMLVIDRSGSMILERRLEFAKLGANLFTNFVRANDGLGVASFSSSASVNFPLTTVTGSGTRMAAQAAINPLVASGATNIGGGLLAGLGQITAQPDRSCNEIIVLLSDGDHTTGTPPAAVIPSLQAAGVTVLSVGVGSGISTAGQATLQSIAAQTGGKFFRVGSAFDLVGLFLRLALESVGSGLLTRAPEAIAPGQTKETPVLVEAGATGATFAVTFGEAGDQITLSLRTPSGAVIRQTSVIPGSGIDFIGGPNSKAFQIQNPEPGTWKIVVIAGAVVSGTLEILGFADHDGVDLSALVEKDTLVFPEAVEVHSTPRFGGEAVVGAIVTGLVTRPDGSKVPVNLFDDGLPGHADPIADDGIYSARFSNYSGNGTYTFDLTVMNTAGTTFAGELLFPDDPSNTKPVPPFTRTTSVTAVVTSVPPMLLACDFDSDVDVDKNDLAILLLDRNKSVASSTCGQSCDRDGDGLITNLDARKCSLLCTRSGCMP